MAKEKWYFTFGIGTVNRGRFIVLFGTKDKTRKEMFSRFGENWAFQYDSYSWENYKSNSKGRKITQADFYNLIEIIKEDN